MKTAASWVSINNNNTIVEMMKTISTDHLLSQTKEEILPKYNPFTQFPIDKAITERAAIAK